MSKKTDEFEQSIVDSIEGTSNIPLEIPSWLAGEGIIAGSRVIEVKRVGSSGSKTDVIIRLSNSEAIKISAKLSSADYFGNWYSHKRVIEEFGEDAFGRLVNDCTKWSNEWKVNPSAAMFVGVSICFGKRSGNTAREFTDVFTYEDIVKVVAGYGSNDKIANCLYISSKAPKNMDELLANLVPINEETILKLSSNFKIAYRPINPMTESSNRGKATYTQFRPFKRLDEITLVDNLAELVKLGEYVEVESNSLNHNRLLNELENDYNIVIPRK